MLNLLDEFTRESLAIRVRSAPPAARLGRGTFNALTAIFQCAVKGAFSQWVRFPPGDCRSSR